MREADVRYALRALGVRPRRELGQSFLLDEGIASRIVDQAELTGEEIVLEIGAGLGILTETLLRRAGQVVAVEIEPRLCEGLKARLRGFRNLTLLNEDVLSLDLGELLRGWGRERGKVVSNPPYHISSSILDYIIKNRARIQLAVLTLQDEVARRVVSGPGNRDYGLLSVLVQYHAEPEVLFSIPPSAFYPSPRVVSTVVRMRLRTSPAISADERLFFRVLNASFSQRRKMLRNALRASFSREVVEGTATEGCVDLTRRAETLSLAEFGQLTDALGRAMESSGSGAGGSDEGGGS